MSVFPWCQHMLLQLHGREFTDTYIGNTTWQFMHSNEYLGGTPPPCRYGYTVSSGPYSVTAGLTEIYKDNCILWKDYSAQQCIEMRKLIPNCRDTRFT